MVSNYYFRIIIFECIAVVVSYISLPKKLKKINKDYFISLLIAKLEFLALEILEDEY